jgi:hypothetical protein
MTDVAVLWWGSYEYGEVTVGDLMSVSALCAALARRGVSFDVVQDRKRCHRPAVPGFEDRDAAWAEVDPTGYRAALFVCGPLPTEWPEGRARLTAFSAARRVAVGGTLTRPEALPAALDTFHEIFCRDGFERAWMDLSPACDWPVAPAPDRAGLGLCWRGYEGFYAGRGCGDRLVAETTALAAHRLGLPTRPIGTDILADGPEPAALDAQFGRVEAVVTTRLHGSLLSLRHGTPWIAIDQIVGGAKVRAMGAQLGWPDTWAVEALRLDALEAALAELIAGRRGALLARVRARARERAFETLAAVEGALERAL